MQCEHCKQVCISKGGLTRHIKSKHTAPVTANLVVAAHAPAVGKRFIDLFCGIGGFHQALASLGHTCVFASDIDSACRKIYHRNYGIMPDGDLTKILPTSIPAFDILCAGFPCQPFSKAGLQKGFEDDRGNLFFVMCRIIQHHQPEYLLFENVRNLSTHDKGNTWKTIRDTIRTLGYTTYNDPFILNALHVNVPQHRERVFILCRRGELPPLPVLPKKPRSTNTLSSITEQNIPPHLPIKITHVETVWNNLIQLVIQHRLTMPKFPIWTDWWDKDLTQDPDMYKKYTNWIDKNRSWYNDHLAILHPWLITSRADPHWKGAVRKLEWQAGIIRPNDGMNTVLWSVRGSGIRIKRPDYIPTLVAMNQTPVYGPERRYLTPRELLRLQSFPDTFQFDESSIHKQVGNAVNVEMARRCASLLLQGTF